MEPKTKKLEDSKTEKLKKTDKLRNIGTQSGEFVK